MAFSDNTDDVKLKYYNKHKGSLKMNKKMYYN